MSKVKGRPTKAMPLHRVLREVYRHYLEFRDLVQQDGRDHVIDHGYWVYDEDGETILGKETVSISFWDLHGMLESLSPRKKEAMFYNVILDMKQQDVADIMGITTVSVGQYVEQACQQIAEKYFAETQKEAELDAA